MTQKFKNNLNFRVYEASKNWKTKKDWISGYKISLKNDLSSTLKNEIKGKYVSGGGYWRSCRIKLDTINEAKDTLTKSDWLTLLKREQSMALHRLNFFGLKVTQKYDFESISEKFDKKLAAEVREAKLADKKAQKLAEDKAKKETEEKAKKLAEEKIKKLAHEKAKREAEDKARLVAMKKEKEIIKNLNWFRMSSEGFKRILISDNYIFNFKNSQNNELKVLHNKINKYLQLSNTKISNDIILELKKTLEVYNKLFHKVHEENKNSGVYGKFNYRNIPIELRTNLENDFRKVNKKLIQFIKILNSYFDTYVDFKNETNTSLNNFMQSKFNENEYNYFTKIISEEKINELEKIHRISDKTFHQKFLMKASYHVSLGNKVELAIKQ